jgi:hypothetical protein
MMITNKKKLKELALKKLEIIEDRMDLSYLM